MQAPAVQLARVAPNASAASAVAALFVQDCERGGPGVVIPRPEVHLVARFGSVARGGLDVHVFGGRHRVHRKLIQDGQRAVTARLPLGACTAVLGVPGVALAARVVVLEDLWGDIAARRLCARLAEARDTASAAAILASAIAERSTNPKVRRDGIELALAAATRLTTAGVQSVADSLGVSERHLRRVFRETVGMGPKSFVKLTRFRRALLAARRSEAANWASIAAEVGYYDQAHLIAEFRAIAGVTPRALLGELGAARWLM